MSAPHERWLSDSLVKQWSDSWCTPVGFFSFPQERGDQAPFSNQEKWKQCLREHTWPQTSELVCHHFFSNSLQMTHITVAFEPLNLATARATFERDEVTSLPGGQRTGLSHRQCRRSVRGPAIYVSSYSSASASGEVNSHFILGGFQPELSSWGGAALGWPSTMMVIYSKTTSQFPAILFTYLSVLALQWVMEAVPVQPNIVKQSSCMILLSKNQYFL